VLIRNGYKGEEPVRLVRADPYLFGPPHMIQHITLSTAATIDFFGDANDWQDVAVSLSADS
jgi:hypothetical protein